MYIADRRAKWIFITGPDQRQRDWLLGRDIDAPYLQLCAGAGLLAIQLDPRGAIVRQSGAWYMQGQHQQDRNTLYKDSITHSYHLD